MSPLITAGRSLLTLAAWLTATTDLLIQIALGLVLVLLLIRFLVDKFNLNPFGRIAYYARRPTNKWFYEIKNSQFYQPLRQAFGFDPLWILLIVAFVLFFYLLRSLVQDVAILLSSIGYTLNYFGEGAMLQGVRAVIGTVLLAAIYFLMALMTILVIYSWFGLFDRAADWAGRRIYPVLYSFDSSGRLGPLIFLLAFLILGFVASAVQNAFF
ncbi:MAG: hypothetical protein HYR56_27475 [Acidobacteria bacterium]|nr:hypothetical protein [Acidobacteriota bacterium]MBI3424589.1 hypothetical protein [Acidobacteriota bacterium]